jgi:tRNA G37 N-methylase Trm5
MAGVKGKSGRFKKGSKLSKSNQNKPFKSGALLDKNILKSKSNQNKPISRPILSENQNENQNKPIENTVQNGNLDALEPQIPIKTEVNFEDAAAKIALESAEAVENQNKTESNQNENQIESQNETVEDDSLKPMLSLGYNIIGQILKESTGVNEADYTPEEVKELSEHTNKIIVTFWPECTKGLTPQQQALLFSGAAIVNIHVEKAKLIFAIKKMELEKEKIKLEQLKLEKELKENKNESKSAA